MAAIDLTNQRFGRLLVFYRDTNIRKEAAWYCVCDCGNSATVAGYSLRNGITISCGCYKAEEVSKRSLKNLVGMVFGSITVLSSAGRTKRQQALWNVRCSCGKEYSMSGSKLTSMGVTKCKQCAMDDLHKSKITHGESRTKKYRTFLQRLRYQKQKGLDAEWVYEMEQALVVFQPSCVICNGTKRLCTDHVYPLSKNYGLKPGNAVRLCNYCNLKKMDKLPKDLPAEWRDKILLAAEEFKSAWESGFRA